jgi:hypothetical protein
MAGAYLVLAGEVEVGRDEALFIGRARQHLSPWVDDHRAAKALECFIAANLDFARQDDVRDKLPSLANRVAGAYRWPDEVRA